MRGIFEDMLSHYETSTSEGMRNATLEVIQQIALSGLQRGGFFDKAAFYGGTCLRIFHGLKRFSEDMDFTLMRKNESFNLEDYFPAVISEFKALGREIEITKKDKKSFGKIESAFLKDNTHVYNLAFQTEKSYKIKLEIDIEPPLKFEAEAKLLMQPFSFFTRCMTLPDLYAGKMHALIFRSWGNRVKGRDWYDFEWYVRKGVKLNFDHLKERALEFNGIELTKELFFDLLKERLANTDISLVKKDVTPYLMNKGEIDIWSKDYFLELAERVRLV